MSAVLDEARRAAILYQAVLARLGAVAAASVFRSWQGTAAPLPDAGREAWRLQAQTIVANSHTVAGRVGIGYYQLVRALLTGAAITGPGEQARALTLADLRAQWERLTRTPYGDRSTADATRIDMETLEDFNDRYAARRAAVLAQVEQIISGAAVDLANQRLAEAGPGADLTELHNAAGERIAATADKLAKAGGRGAVWDSLQSDPRAIGYVRVSLDPPPCYFCYILMSQGGTYGSKRAALVGADGNSYHDRCGCVAVPLFTEDQYAGGEFDLHRQYRARWDDLYRQYGDSYEAMRALRRSLDAEQRATSSTAVPATAI